MQPTFGDGLFLHILQKKWPLLTSIKSFFPCYIYFTRYREFLPVYGCSTFEPVLIQRLLAHKIIKYGFLSVHFYQKNASNSVTSEIVGSCIMNWVSIFYSGGNFLRPVVGSVEPVVVFLLEVGRVGAALSGNLFTQGTGIRVKLA